MRKYLVYGTKLLYGFFIMSVLYCSVYEQITHDVKTAFGYSLFFLPVLFGCSLGIKKAGGVIQYSLLSIVLLAGAFGITGYMGSSRLDQIVLMIFCIWIIMSYFMARATRRICWLEQPLFWVLPLYLAVCIYGAYFQSDFLVKLASFAAGCSYLSVQIIANDQTMHAFIQDYSNMERLPVQRMRQNNNRMLGLKSLITAVTMMVAPYLKADELIIKLGLLLRAFLVWFLGFFAGKEEEPVMEQAAGQADHGFGFPPIEENDSLLMKILDMILEIVSWVLFIGLMALLAYLILKRILHLYQQFNQRVEENGDLVENLMAAKNEDKIHLNGKTKENLFFNLSPNARIRKYYKKRIQKENREEIRHSWTPEELERAVNLQAEKKEKFHAYYEKARYSEEDCTKEEMQEMLGL